MYLFNLFRSNVVRMLCLIALITMSFGLQIKAQSSSGNGIEVSGVILDESSQPIIGATVASVKGGFGAVSDMDGRFVFTVPQNHEINVSFVGYKTQTFLASQMKNLRIVLKPDVEIMEEVVVVGYGTQRKKDLTGAISTVDKDVIKNKSVTTIGDALQGAAPGVHVRSGSQPGTGAAIEIRGISSLTNNSPLFVIDGLLTSDSRDLNPADIESIQILKDASAAAIYGSRAANGVVVVTTKKGQQGPMKIDVSLKKSFQMPTKYELMDRKGFITLNNMAYDNAGIPRQQHPAEINTDWQEEAFRTGDVDDYNITLSGGGEKSRYMISGNFFDNDGITLASNFRRMGVRVNTEAKKGIFTFGENLYFNYSKARNPFSNPYYDVLRMLPTIPVYDERNPGGFGYGDASAKTFGTNPVAINSLNKNSNINYRVSGNMYAEIAILKSLKYKLNWGYDNNQSNYKSVRFPGNWTMNQPNEKSNIYENRSGYYSSIIDNTLTFDDTFGKHNINAVVGTTYQREQYSIVGAKKFQLTPLGNGGFLEEIDAATEDPEAAGSSAESVMLSYLGRVNYNFDDKYLASFTIRADGSSKFRKGNRWGVFPSFSAGWRISKEKFFRVKWIDDLKVRANYGTLGSVNIGNYAYSALINTGIPTVFGGQMVNGSTQVKLVNQDIKWETLEQQNYGLDMTMLDNRLYLSMDYFISHSKDILYPTPIASSTGNDGGNPIVNAASIKNSGFELTFNWKDQIKDVKYNIGLNLSTVKNKITNLGYDGATVVTGTTKSEVGQPIGMWYLIQTDGLFQNWDEINNYRTKDATLIQPNAQPGDIRYVDANGDGKIDDADRVVVGSPWADVEGTLNLGVQWKGFDLSMNWYASIGGKLYNSMRTIVDRFDDNSNYRKHVHPWRHEGDTEDPRAVFASTSNSWGNTDRWLENGSFLKLKEITLGYNFADLLLKKYGIDQCRLYVSAQNVFTVTGYTGLDPEFSGSLYTRGQDPMGYPNALTITVGLGLTF